jgi:hypothetical protein
MSTKITTSVNVDLDSAEVTLTTDDAIETNVGYEDVTLDTKESIVEGYKKEYSIIGDGLYASINQDEAPEWLVGLIGNLTNAAISSGFNDYDQVVQEVRNAIDAIDIARNTYVEQINFAPLVDGIVASKLETLNASIDSTYATKTELDVAVATSKQSAIQEVTDLATGFNDTTNARITNVNSLLTDADSSLADSINAVNASLNIRGQEIDANAEAIQGLNSYVGVSETGNPDGTGILASLTVLQKQNDGQIETFVGQHHVVVHDTDPNDGQDIEQLLTDQWPYALWTPMEGTTNPTFTTRTANKGTESASYPVPEHTVYHNTTDNTYWEYSIINGWEEIIEADFNARRETVRASHIGDTFINYGYAADGVTREYHESLKFIKNTPDDTDPYSTDSEGYSWALITDNDAEAAYLQALNAYDLADNKRRVFIDTPTGPYDAGDLWVDSSVTPQIVKVATVARVSGYDEEEWVQADQQAQNFITDTYSSDQTKINGQLDGKIEYFFYDSYGSIEVSENQPATTSTEALDAIKADWTTDTLRLANHGNVVYFRDTLDAYWYQYSTSGWLTLTDTSIYQALQKAAEAQSAADSKVSHYYAWFDPANNADPSDFEIQEYQEATEGIYVLNETETGYVDYDSNNYGEGDPVPTRYNLVTIDTVTAEGFKYWLKRTAVTPEPESAPIYTLYYFTNEAWSIYPNVSEGDVVICYNINILDEVAFTRIGSNWERTGVDGVISKSNSFTNLANDVRGPTGLVANSISALRTDSLAYADEVSANVESKFAFDSTLKLNGEYYKSGFGITSEGIAEVDQNGDGESVATAFDSEFWVRADRFVLTNADASTKATFDVSDNTIKLGVEHTEATRNVGQGSYVSATTYVKGDIVSYNGSSFLALKNTDATPVNDNDNWQLLAAQGSTPVLLDIAPDAAWPTETDEAGALTYSFTSDFSGNVIIKVLAYDAEGSGSDGVRIKFNGSTVQPFYRTLADSTEEWYEFVYDNLNAGNNTIKFWSTTADGGTIKEIKAAFVGATGATGGYVDYLFTRKQTEPLDPGGADDWYTSVTDVPAGSGYLWSIKKSVSAGGVTTAYSDKRVITSPIIRELIIYSDALSITADVVAPQSSKYNFSTNTLTIGAIAQNEPNWSTSIPNIDNNETVYVTNAVVTGNETETEVDITWNTPSLYTRRVDGTNGVSVTGISEEYQISSDGTTAPTGDWFSTIAGAGELTDSNKYLWVKATTTFSDSTTSIIYRLAAVKGQEGQAGPAGPITWGAKIEYDDMYGPSTAIPAYLQISSSPGSLNIGAVSSTAGDYTFFGGSDDLRLGSDRLYNYSLSTAPALGREPTLILSDNINYVLIRDPDQTGITRSSVLSRVEGETYIRFRVGTSSSSVTLKVTVASSVTLPNGFTYYLFGVEHVEGSTYGVSVGDNNPVSFEFSLAENGRAGAGFYSGTFSTLATTDAGITQNFINTVGRAPVLGDVFIQKSSAIVGLTSTKRYDGGNWQDPEAVISGDLIVEGGITAENLAATSLSTLFLDAGTITAGILQAGNDDLSVDPNSKFVIDLNNQRLEIRDESGAVRVRLGKLV